MTGACLVGRLTPLSLPHHNPPPPPKKQDPDYAIEIAKVNVPLKGGLGLGLEELRRGRDGTWAAAAMGGMSVSVCQSIDRAICSRTTPRIIEPPAGRGCVLVSSVAAGSNAEKSGKILVGDMICYLGKEPKNMVRA